MPALGSTAGVLGQVVLRLAASVVERMTARTSGKGMLLFVEESILTLAIFVALVN